MRKTYGVLIECRIEHEQPELCRPIPDQTWSHLVFAQQADDDDPEECDALAELDPVRAIELAFGEAECLYEGREITETVTCRLLSEGDGLIHHDDLPFLGGNTTLNVDTWDHLYKMWIDRFGDVQYHIIHWSNEME